MSVSWSIWRCSILLKVISKIENAKKWTSVDATVVDSRYSGKRKKNTKIHFYAEYTYNGINYGTQNLTFKEKKGKFERALVSKMNPGDKVKIYINPKKPYESVCLKPIEHSYFSDWFKMMLGLIFSLYLIYLMVF